MKEILVGRKLKRQQFKKISGEFYGTPKEVYGFRTHKIPGSSNDVARSFLQANTELFQLEPNLEGLKTRQIIRSLGANHVILEQWHNDIRVHRGYVTVHADLSGRVYLAKNRAVPAPLLPEVFDERVTWRAALERARRSLPKARGPATVHGVPEKVWYPKKEKLLPAWKFRLIRRKPRQDWIVYVSAKTGHLIHRYDNLSESRPAPALVFDPSPVTKLGDHEELLKTKKTVRRPPEDAYREVSLMGLEEGGYLTGEHVSTKPTRHRIRRMDGKFMFRSHQRGFEEVMVYFHIDSSLRYLGRLGYKGKLAIFKDVVPVNVNGTREDNSFYSPSEKMLTFGTGEIDDAEDAETILHELGHAIQDAICPDFGQSPEAAAMGEGFGDYWAASAFEGKKPDRYRTSVMTWDGLLLGLESNLNPPSLRRLDSYKTFDDFDEKGDEHDNGEIWSAVLWDVRKVLGHEAADRVIIESHFQQDGFTTFARGARAILDADRNLEAGRHVEALRAVLRRRNIGPLD